MKTDLLMITVDAATATFFSLLGAVALGGVLCGAWWHLFTVAASGLMVWASVREIIAVSKKSD